VELGRYAGNPNLWNLPGLGDMRYSARVNLLGSRVESVHIEFWHSDYPRMKAVMTERYGEPTRIERATLTSRAGAVVNTETLRWDGARNSVFLFQRLDRIDKSMAAFVSNSLSAERAKRTNESIRDTASQM